jgi:hypothetical protein
MKGVRDAILEQLQPLVGLRLSIARRALDLRNFQFGVVRAIEGGTVGEFALHIQCPWRIETRDRIVTGRDDLREPIVVTKDFDWKAWDYEKDGNLQDQRIASLLGGYDPGTRSPVNNGHLLVVEAVDADDRGGVTLDLSGGYRLRLFPAGTRGEDWRIFRPDSESPHFVIAGGTVERDDAA